MAVQYVPQFIPTNTQALQGVLSEYQRAYDANLARELEIQDQYSAIPTISAADTAIKNEILGKFSNTLGEVEKKYNYDRASSAYSKELARKITELRKNDFWSYNEMKKQKYDLEQKMKAQLGQWYYSPINVSDITYENKDALNTWKPYNKQDIQAIGEALGAEHATSFRNPIAPQMINDPRTGQPVSMLVGDQYGYKDIESAYTFLGQKEGQAMVDKAILGAGFGQEALTDPSVRQIATQALASKLVGEKKQYMVDLPNLPTNNGPTTNQGTPWIPIGSIPVGDKIQTPEGFKNIKQGEKLEDRESKEYYEAIKNSVLNEDKNTTVINRGKETLNQALSSTGISNIDGLFNELIDLYNTTGTGKTKEFFSITGNAKSSRTVIYDYLKSKGVRNPGHIADAASDKIDSWYNGEYKDIKKEINSRIKEGYTQNYDIYIPPIQSATDTKEVVTFLQDYNNLYASSTISGESDLIDKKALDKFNSIEGDARIAILQAPGKLPILRLFKGDVKDENVFDITSKPNVSGYALWSELSRVTNLPLVSDAYLSNIKIVPNVTYGINKEIDPTGEKKNIYSTYLTDMMRNNPSYREKNNSELKEMVNNKLENIYWKQSVNDDGSSSYKIYYGNNELPTSRPLVSIEDLMLTLRNIVEN